MSSIEMMEKFLLSSMREGMGIPTRLSLSSREAVGRSGWSGGEPGTCVSECVSAYMCVWCVWCVCVCVCVYMYVCMYVRECVYVCVSACVCMHV